MPSKSVIAINFVVLCVWDKSVITFVVFCVQVLLHYQSVSEPAVVRKLISVLNKSSGELMKKKPRYTVVDAHEAKHSSQ